jgi:small-conductance mechanosensitive channel
VIRDLVLRDAIVAGAALVVGVTAGLLLRVVLRRLHDRTRLTRSSYDDVLVEGLQFVLPWSAFIGGGWAAAAALPLAATADRRVHTVCVAGLVLVATFAASHIVAALVRSVTLARSGVAGSVTIFVNIVRITVLSIGVLVLLQTLGISVAPLLTALGVGGLAVALALQDTLANLFAGVHILASKKVQPGDYVQMGTGQEGYVVDINWRNTIVRQLPDNILIVPNAQLASAVLVNYHQPAPQMSVLVQVGVSYESDLAHVETVTAEVGREVMMEVPGGVPDHTPFVRYHTFGEWSINFSVILRANEYTDQYLIKHEFIKRLHDRFRLEGIEIPFPGRAVMWPGYPEPGRPEAADHAVVAELSEPKQWVGSR